MRPLITLFLCSHLLNAITVHGDEADTQSTQRIDIGATVNEFSFTDIRYLSRSLSEFGERKAFVVMFTTLDCPIVRRALPTLRRLEEEFRSQGVVLDAAMQLRYRGRIDSAFRLTGVQPNPGREDLREAIEDVLAARDVRVSETPVDGHYKVTASREFRYLAIDPATGHVIEN